MPEREGTYFWAGPRRMMAWQIITYPVVYDADRGENPPAAQVKTWGEVSNLNEEAPTRADYTFLGWGMDAASDEVVYQPGDSYTANAPPTLYALWNENRQAGDVNGDKAVDGRDALRLLRWLAEQDVFLSAVVVNICCFHSKCGICCSVDTET